MLILVMGILVSAGWLALLLVPAGPAPKPSPASADVDIRDGLTSAVLTPDESAPGKPTLWTALDDLQLTRLLKRASSS
jgi:hypothetical protein